MRLRNTCAIGCAKKTAENAFNAKRLHRKHIPLLFVDEKPDVQYADIGGMDIQKQEVREAVELPLTHFDLYKQIGIDPPRGVLMYGPPGCGKTMLAKAVAHHTTGTYTHIHIYHPYSQHSTLLLSFLNVQHMDVYEHI